MNEALKKGAAAGTTAQVVTIASDVATKAVDKVISSARRVKWNGGIE